jgi:hypothetical protein
MQHGDWLHTRAFAALLGPGVSERTVREMCRRGQLACVPLGAPDSQRPRWFVHKDALDAYLRGEG